ncbi:MAG: FtsX-like permease family protein [Acidimicrobiales bacterium]
MNWFDAVRTATGRMANHKVQAFVIGVVLAASTASATLGIALLAAVNAPFQHAFAAHNGADVTLTVDASRISQNQLAASRSLPGVAAISGPFPETTAVVSFGGNSLGPRLLVARPSPKGPVDDVTLSAGQWPDRPGQVVLYSGDDGGGGFPVLGDTVEVSGPSGVHSLTVVGFAASVTGTADGWVNTTEMSRVQSSGTPPNEQVLYRFANAATDAEIASDIAEIKHALPPGAVTGASTWLTSERKAAGNAVIIQPFIISFALLGLAMAILIVANVVSAAVVSQYRRIGVLKSIGFTPAHVATTYLLRIGAPAALGGVAGVVLGNVAAVPVLHHSSGIYGVGKPSAPLWASAVAFVGMFALTMLAALTPALRAGKLSAVEAIAAGRAPRAGHGFLAHRIAGRLPLPRPVRIGLAHPFTRPSRSIVTVAAIAFGVTAVMFAVGLTSVLGRVQQAQTLSNTAPVQLQLNNPHTVPSTAVDAAAVAALRAQPGTSRYVAVYGGDTADHVQIPGVSQSVTATAFGGDSSWLGYSLIAGRWYNAAGEVAVNSAFLSDSGLTIGDTTIIGVLGGSDVTTTIRIVGEVFAPHDQPWLFTSAQTLPGVAIRQNLRGYDIGLRPSTSPSDYIHQVNSTLAGHSPWTATRPQGNSFYGIATSLIALLAALVAIGAGLGVLNTIMMTTNDRVHDLGIFKALGMRPTQIISMVTSQIVIPAILAAAIAAPIATVLTTTAVHAMANAAHSSIPASFSHVLPPSRLALVSLAGLAIALAGAILPATWAARATPAAALRAE